MNVPGFSKWHLQAGIVPWVGLAALLGLAGCEDTTAGDDDSAADDDIPADDDATADDDTSGGASITFADPAPDSTDAYYRQDIHVEFSGPVTDVTVTLAAVAGGDVAGETTRDEDLYEVTLNPSANLSSNTAYHITVAFDGATEEWDFTTSALGSPVGDSSTLIGKTYNLDLAHANITQPEGVGSILGSYLTDVIILFSPTEVDDVDQSIQVVGALGTEDGGSLTQDMCSPSLGLTEVTPGQWNNPYFQVGPALFETDIEGINVVIQDLLIAGDFEPDGSSVQEAIFAGQVDTRDFADLLDPGNPDAICQLIEGLGIPCEACPQDGLEYCLTVRAQDISAEEVPGLTLVTRSEAEVAADPACAE